MIDFRYFPTVTDETYLIVDKLMGLKLHEAERDKIFISSKHYSISPSRSLSLGLGKIGHLIADVMREVTRVNIRVRITIVQGQDA